MKLKRANLKNVAAAFRRGGPQHVIGDCVIPGTIYFLPRRAYDNGHISFDNCDGAINRMMFNRLTRKQVKHYILDQFTHHYLLW